MMVWTTAGFLLVESNGETLKFRTPDKASADALADGIELVAGDIRPPVLEESGLFYVFNVPRDAFAAFMAHEIENYIDYSDFHIAVKESRGEGWYNQLRKIDFHIGELT